MIVKFLVNKYKRILVRIRQYKAKKKFKSAMKDLTSEQLKVFNTVIDIAKKNKEAIRFDPITSETLIVLPHRLITLMHNSVSVQNTEGFYTEHYPSETFDVLMNIVNIEAHRERRKLKYEVRLRIQSFLNKFNEETV